MAQLFYLLSMKHSHKLFINTIALFFKIFINVLVTLYVTKIAFQRLGLSDFGIYNLIAGVIALLSFLNASLMVSAQRFFSFSIGSNNQDGLKAAFNVSFIIHLLLAIAVMTLLLILQPLLFNEVLNIPEQSRDAAIIVYDIMAFSSAIIICATPYAAAINAHEHMLFYAVSEIVYILIKLLAAIVLLYINENLLVVYTCMMVFAIFAGAFIKYIWCKRKYIETNLSIAAMRNKSLARQMIGFVGWNAIGSMASVVGIQGSAIVLNNFFGSDINATYGIANQISALVLYFASTIIAIFSPTIIQAFWAGDNNRLKFTSVFASKISFFLSSMVALPMIVYMDDILSIWLGTPPNYTNFFCILVILAFIIQQLCPGINRAIYASGRIKGYQIAMSISILSTIPLGIILFKIGLPPYSIIYLMIFAQVLVLIETLYYARVVLQFPIRGLIFKYLMPACIIFLLSCIVYKILSWNINIEGRITTIILSSIIYCLIYAAIFYCLVFDKQEKISIKGLYHDFVLRFISCK